MHIGLVCPELSGHLNPVLALGRELARRGHRVTFVGKLDARDKVGDAGLGFEAVGEAEFPLGSTPELSARLGALSGRRAIAFTIAEFLRATRMFLRESPAVMERLRLDGLVVDQTSPAGGTVADRFGLPFVTVASALLLNEEPDVPPAVTGWPYRPTFGGRLRNRIGYAVFRAKTRPVLDLINEQRREWRMPPHRARPDFYSPLAQLGQLPREFDFPRRQLPAWFHYVGPLSDGSGRAAAPFPWERLDGRPLIYASLGTLQNRVLDVFRAIAAGCADLDAQLVLSLGRADAEPPGDFAGEPLIVPFAPQLELVRRAAAVITHAGMNTVMESLAEGVPLVAVPITNDQPGVAARVAWNGVGEVVPLRKVSPQRIRSAVARVLSDEHYRVEAQRIQKVIHRAGGLAHAATIAELAFQTREPVGSGTVDIRSEAHGPEPVGARSNT
ncbi:MAG: glycosyltransferase [Planctomycetes bacterium]|nr:glycosyltransferase [Planctomycetota bacterium]